MINSIQLAVGFYSSLRDKQERITFHRGAIMNIWGTRFSPYQKSPQLRMTLHLSDLLWVPLIDIIWFNCVRQKFAMIDQCIQNCKLKNILSPSNSSKYTSNQVQLIQHIQVGQTWISWHTFNHTLLERNLQASQFTNTPIFLLPLKIYRVWLAPSLAIWTELEFGRPCGFEPAILLPVHSSMTT